MKRSETERVEYALSCSDIDTLLPGIPVKVYGELEDVRSLDEVLDNRWNACVLLYEVREGYGHWVCVLRRGKVVVECFDSYGFVPDDQLNWISKTFRKQSDQDYPHLTKLLYESGYTVHYNDHRLQQQKEGINTCGRWCVARIKNAHLNENQFATMVRKEAKKQGLTNDEWVCRYVVLD